jgi:hypothetical protein
VGTEEIGNCWPVALLAPSARETNELQSIMLDDFDNVSGACSSSSGACSSSSECLETLTGYNNTTATLLQCYQNHSPPTSLQGYHSI